MSAVSIELTYPDLRPRGKYCAKRHTCHKCNLPADWVGKENGVPTYLCFYHADEWEEARGLKTPEQKVAA